MYMFIMVIGSTGFQAALRRLQRLAESVETAEPTEVGFVRAMGKTMENRPCFFPCVPWKSH